MKNLFLLLLLSYGFTNAQNVEYLKHANNCDANFARQFSDDIASSSRIKYVFFKELKTLKENYSTFIYVPIDATEEDKKSLKAHMVYGESQTNFESEGNLCVHFSIIYEGANKDLEIKGTPKYQFEFVQNKFLDLFDFWQKNVDPLADKEKITAKGISSIRNNEKGYWYNFSRSSDGSYWYIKNYTYRINE
jgi:hypothetical protein